MKVEVSIDPACKEPKVIILTDKMTEEIEQIMQQVSTKAADSLAVFSNRGVEMIACNDILRIYTEAKKSVRPDGRWHLHGAISLIRT